MLLHAVRGVSSHAAHWPSETFAAMGDALSQAFGAPVVLTGSQRERDIAQGIAAAMRARVYNAAGLSTLRSFAALAQRAIVVVALDSGPMHVAAAVGAPTVGIFALRTDLPNRWRPLGPQVAVVRTELCVPALVPERDLSARSRATQRSPSIACYRLARDVAGRGSASRSRFRERVRHRPAITVQLCTYNRKALLGRVLAALFRPGPRSGRLRDRSRRRRLDRRIVRNHHATLRADLRAPRRPPAQRRPGARPQRRHRARARRVSSCSWTTTCLRRRVCCRPTCAFIASIRARSAAVRSSTSTLSMTLPPAVILVAQLFRRVLLDDQRVAAARAREGRRAASTSASASTAGRTSNSASGCAAGRTVDPRARRDRLPLSSPRCRRERAEHGCEQARAQARTAVQFLAEASALARRACDRPQCRRPLWWSGVARAAAGRECSRHRRRRQRASSRLPLNVRRWAAQRLARAAYFDELARRAAALRPYATTGSRRTRSASSSSARTASATSSCRRRRSPRSGGRGRARRSRLSSPTTRNRCCATIRTSTRRTSCRRSRRARSRASALRRRRRSDLVVALAPRTDDLLGGLLDACPATHRLRLPAPLFRVASPRAASDRPLLLGSGSRTGRPLSGPTGRARGPSSAGARRARGRVAAVRPIGSCCGSATTTGVRARRRRREERSRSTWRRVGSSRISVSRRRCARSSCASRRCGGTCW